MQDQKPAQTPHPPEPNSNLSSSPPPGSLAMPRPITPIIPPGQQPPKQDIAPTNEEELLSLLEKTNKNKEPILSKFPSLQSGLPKAGHIVTPYKPPTDRLRSPSGLPAATARPGQLTGGSVFSSSQPAIYQPLPPSPITPPPPSRPQVAQPAPAKPQAIPARISDEPQTAANPSRFNLRGLLVNRGLLFIPLFIAASTFLLFAAPWTRYHLAGIFINKNLTIQVLDATTGAPVSNAVVSSGEKRALTDGRGRAVLASVNPGFINLAVTKENYRGQQIRTLVPILNPKETPGVSLSTTGNLVEVSVRNKMSGEGVGGVLIKTAAVTAQTDPEGNALMALSDSGAKVPATVVFEGYNEQMLDLNPVAGEVAKADVSLTPAGKAYYLAKSTTGVDVMGADLDGSNPKLLLGGSGLENTNTRLLNSPSSQYLALVARRSADPHAQLYVIDTVSGKLTQADFGSGEFTLYGWLGNTIIYSLTYDNVHTWQNGKSILRSYDASIQKRFTLNEAVGSGSSAASAHQTYRGVMLTGKNLIYGLTWQTAGRLDNQLSGKTNTLIASSPQGASTRTIASYDASKFIIDFTQHSPANLYIRRTSISGGSTYFDFRTGDDQPSPVSITSSQFNQKYPKYFLSPSGNRVAWLENLAGKDSLVAGDSNGQNPSVIYSGSGFELYAWQGDDYVLAVKNKILYTLSVSGGKPVKIASIF